MKNKTVIFIEVFVTKTCKFRARIKEGDNPVYEVTVGGKSWDEGKGRKYEDIIRRKCLSIMYKLENQLTTFRETKL